MGGDRTCRAPGARRAAVAFLAGVWAFALAGCTVGPDFRRPEPPVADHYLPIGAPARPASAQRLVAGGTVEGRWWTLFGSAKLEALEAEALAHNADLAAARAALRQAHELYLAQRSAGFPTLQASASGSRTKNSYTIASPLSSNAQLYSLYAGQFDAAYVLDIFGGQRRRVEAAAAQEEIQRFQGEAAYLALTTNVAGTALQIAALRSQLAAATGAVAADRQALDITRHMAARGEVSAADVAAAEGAMAQAEQTVPPLQKQIGQLDDQLAILVGRAPAEVQSLQLDLADVRLPAELPLSLPSELVRQRPDVRAAEANLHAASAQVGVAIAARLPSLTLDGSLGGTSTKLGTLFSNGNDLWSISGSATAPVFDAGALRRQQKAAEAALAQAKAQYRGAVLAALQNTADVLQAMDADAVILQQAALASEAAARSSRIAQAQFKAGETGALPALAAEAAYQQAQQTLIQAEGARYADTVALLQALGGGWWNNPQALEEARQ